MNEMVYNLQLFGIHKSNDVIVLCFQAPAAEVAEDDGEHGKIFFSFSIFFSSICFCLFLFHETQDQPYLNPLKNSYQSFSVFQLEYDYGNENVIQ